MAQTGWRRPPALHVAVDTGAGPVVVLVHGIASSSVTFERLVPLLAERHRVIAIDLLGHGGSPPGRRYTVEEHVAALHRTIRGLGLREPFTLVGHSLGSLLSARYAAVRRREVGHLVLVSPPVYLSPRELGDVRDRAAMGLYLRAYEYLRANKRFTIRNAALLARLSPIKGLLRVSEENWDAFVRTLEHSIESQTTISDIAQVRVPIDVVYGTVDPFVTPGGLAIVGAMRQVRVTRVDVSDHVIRRRLARAIAGVIDTADVADAPGV